MAPVALIPARAARPRLRSSCYIEHSIDSQAVRNKELDASKDCNHLAANVINRLFDHENVSTTLCQKLCRVIRFAGLAKITQIATINAHCQAE